MKLAIMQPYFLPYIGYWQLIKAVDIFVIYDNIKYTKKGWINRNRYLLNGIDKYFTLPIKNDSDSLEIKDRNISDSFNRNKILGQISGAYQKAPFYNRGFQLFQTIVENNESNLFEYIYFSIKCICCYLGIETPVIRSSKITIDHSLKSENKVIAICKCLRGDTYINPIGGQKLYSQERFCQEGICLQFIKTKNIQYHQFNNQFVSGLSIIDMIMFNSPDQINQFLGEYDLLSNY